MPFLDDLNAILEDNKKRNININTINSAHNLTPLQNQQEVYTNENDLSTLAQAFGIGTSNMVNNTVLGGAGQILGSLGRAVEAISPWSGDDGQELRSQLILAGIPLEQAREMTPYQDSWLTSLGKSALDARNYIDEGIQNWRNDVLGDNPTLMAQILEGSGSSLGFMGTGIAANALAGPLAAALSIGGAEALSESGGVLADAYKQGQYDQGLATAGKSFLTNAGLNSALNIGLGPFAEHVAKMRNPLSRFGLGTVEEVINELIQEPSQQTIEKAARRDIYNGEDFMPALVDEGGNWWNTVKQLAPSVAGSTLLTQLITGGGNNFYTRQGRQNLYDQYRNRHVDIDKTKADLQAQYEAREKLKQDLETEQNGNNDNNIIEGINARIAEADSQIARLSDMLKPDTFTYSPPKPQQEDSQNNDDSENQNGEQITHIYPRKQRKRRKKNSTPQNDAVMLENITEANDNQIAISNTKENSNPIAENSSSHANEALNIPKNTATTQNTSTQGKNPVVSTIRPQSRTTELIDKKQTDTTIDDIDPSRPAGKTVKIITAKGTEVEAQYRMLELEDLIPSNLENGKVNPAYPQDLQPRTRTSDKDGQIRDIALHIDPERLAENRMASDGAPVIGTDRVVESGNGRTMGLTRAYRLGKAEKYRQYLIQRAEDFGLNPDDVAKMKQPVLVRARLTPVNRVAFASEANVSSIASMGATDTAIDDVKYIAPDMLNDIDITQDIDGNSGFVQRLITRLPANERNSLTDKNDRPSRSAYERAAYALAALAYGDESILSRLSETQDDELRSISNGLLKSAPALATLKNGAIRQNLSLQSDIAEAIDTLLRVKKSKKTLSEFLAQPSILDALSQNAETLVRFLDNHKRSQNDIQQGFINYVQIAKEQANEGQNSMFEDTIRSKEDILAEALRKVDAQKEGGTVAQKSFKQWFGDWQNSPEKASKVVDKNGNPMTVYFGTNEESSDGRPPFSEIDTRENGAWFSATRKGAKQQGSNVHEAYLNLRNPYIHENQNTSNDTQLMEQIVHDVRRGKYGKGYDGVIFRNGIASDIFVAFDKNQIKSPSYNNGNFDTVNDSMFMQDSTQNNDVQNILTNDTQEQNQEISQNDGDLTQETEKNENEKTDKAQESQYDGFIGTLNISDDEGQSFTANLFEDDNNGNPYLDITDENRDSVAIYDMRTDTFSIRPESKKTGWVRRIEDDFRREFGKNPTEEILRRAFKQQATEAGLDEKNAEASATVYMAANKFFARYSGQSLYDTVRSDNLAIIDATNEESGGKRAATIFQKRKTDQNGNVLQEAQTIVKLFENADKSSMLHELGHIFLQKLKDLATAKKLQGDRNRARLDWGKVLNAYDLYGIDFSKELSPEDVKKWRNAQELFASGLEKYFWKGKAPEQTTAKMKGVFRAFKDWLRGIYSALKNIKYTDSKGEQHEFSLDKKIEAVFDDMFADTRNKTKKVIDSGLTLDNLTFLKQEIEKRYSEGAKGVQGRGIIGRIRHAARAFAKSIRSDYPDLVLSPRVRELNLQKAVNEFRQLDRRKTKAVNDALESFAENLRGLTPQQHNLFARMRLLQDLTWRKENTPDAQLPFGFDEDSLRSELERFSALTDTQEDVKKAIQAEEKTMREINSEFIKHARLLGIDLEGVFQNPHYYRHIILDYANATTQGKFIPSAKGNIEIQGMADLAMRAILGRGYMKKYKGSPLDISADYIQANAEVRAQMMQDIETMKTLLFLKENFDIMPTLRSKLKNSTSKQDISASNEESYSQNESEGESLAEAIPEGYEAFDPSATRLIEGDKSSAENVLAMALEDIAQEAKVPLDKILHVLGIEPNSKKIMVLPSELVAVLRKKSQTRHRGMLGQVAKDLTTWWKRSVLFSPFRNLKYNLRNFTGDLDALIAGNPRALQQLPKAFKELVAHYMKAKNEGYKPSKELQEYIDRSAGLGIQSLNLSARDAQAILNMIQDMENPSKIKKAWNTAMKPIRAFFSAEHSFTEWREHLLRYAAYLDYKQQMEQNQDGKPNNWGASLEDEVISLDDIRDRAFKMSNELLGAYDQISETGKQLRDMLVPFYSWIEVNMRRYGRLFKNALKGGNTKNLLGQIMLGKTAAIPAYAVSASMSLGQLALFTLATQMFNRFIWPDADDDLPEDVKYRPHITLGKNGNDVYYFDRIGTLADVLDWASLDSIALDAKNFANGQLTVAGWFKKILQAPVSKAVNSLNPGIKLPIELAMGRSMFPNVFKPSTIRDPAMYVARSFGLSWPYKAVAGIPHNSMQELTNIGIYSVDADEAAYFQTLDRVRQFQNTVLDKHFDGFAVTQRGRILQKIKTALRYNDNKALQQFLREYTQADGTKKGLQQSMKAMHPLHSLSKKEREQFLRWISPDDRKYLRKAERYFRQLTARFIR